MLNTNSVIETVQSNGNLKLKQIHLNNFNFFNAVCENCLNTITYREKMIGIFFIDSDFCRQIEIKRQII